MMLPKLAVLYLPLLLQTQVDIWPDAPMPSFLAAQIEQESCVSLTSAMCWNPRAELKTSREYGFGLGQTTKAYRADGSVRFDKFAELRQEHASLQGWTWDKRFDPGMQMTALIEMDKAICGKLTAATNRDRLAMCLAAYNGGESGLIQDRAICRYTQGCDPARWFGHVELTSSKSRVKWKGYGKSAYETNREYPRNVIDVRREKYIPYMENRP